MFQFTLPHGERPGTPRPSSAPTAFQFTLPHGERRLDGRQQVPDGRFNSRSRMGSDGPAQVFALVFVVSIHAPAWGATAHQGQVRRTTRCFNSRSRMGSDERHARLHPQVAGFNSRSRMGSDPQSNAIEEGVLSFNSRSRMGSDKVTIPFLGLTFVSIHAPAWGATTSRGRDSPTARFQFTLPHGERRRGREGIPKRRWFQFTLPHGERPGSPWCVSFRISFNSRSRMGSDHARY